MSRKDTLRAMLSARDRKLPDSNSSEIESSAHIAEASSEPRVHVRSGAVGAMGRTLGQIAHAAEQARALIASGESVLEIPPEKIEGSFIADRLEADREDHRALVESIRERGQQVPILVRPHPSKAGYYQVAYGHRRVRALAELRLPVRSVVRELSDEELVVAQGQENSARTDLSYIERALFAVALEDRGFDRTIIMAALSMEKTQLSRLISLARAIPGEITTAIGPAPKAGRPRWVSLSERVTQVETGQILAKLLADPEFCTADSDARFVKLFNALAPKRPGQLEKSVPWTSPDGRKIAVIERSGTKLAVVIDEKDAPDFGEFLTHRLPEIYRAFEVRKRREEGS